jgi:hypothetical protein
MVLLSQIPQQSLLGDALGDPGHHPVLYPPRPRRRRACLLTALLPVFFGFAKEITESTLEPGNDARRRWFVFRRWLWLCSLLVVKHVTICAYRDNEDVH